MGAAGGIVCCCRPREMPLLLFSFQVKPLLLEQPPILISYMLPSLHDVIYHPACKHMQEEHLPWSLCSD